ncbi:MAG TPA: hypothetical protein VN622_03230 [Clostridia bacterium]|nr:hypothetical protein [Clostridia bacterium]
MSGALVITIILALAIGIGSGYGVILGILYAFNRNRGENTPPSLVPSTGASGD